MLKNIIFSLFGGVGFYCFIYGAIESDVKIGCFGASLLASLFILSFLESFRK